MANIKNKDLFAGNAISKTTDDVKELIVEFKNLDSEMVSTAKTQKKILNQQDNKTAESVSKTKVAVEELNEAEKKTQVIRKERIKLQQKLKTANSDNIQQNTELKVQIQEQNKINKDLAKNALGLVGAYDKQSKRLRDLRKEYKNLLLSEGKVTDGTEKLRKELVKLDRELKDVDKTAGQFQRNVGNYPDAFEDAEDAVGDFGDEANSVFSDLTVGAAAAAGAIGGIGAAISTSDGANEDSRKITAGATSAWNSFKNAVSSSIVSQIKYAKVLITGGSATEAVTELVKGASSAYNTLAETANNAADAIDLEASIIDSEKALRPLQERIEVLNGLIEQQQIIAGDGTRSFKELSDAVEKGQGLQIRRAGVINELAQEELRIVNERVRIAENQGGVLPALLDEQAEAIRKVIEAENELKNEILENDKEIRQIKQDRLEIELDILIDGFDNQKTINERIIANDKETLERRRGLLEETTQLANDSFESQKEVLDQLSKAGIDVDELLGLDATELAKQIQLLEQSEIINTRTLEVIRERRIVLQDIEDAQQELNDAEQESLDIRADILDQEIALAAGTRDAISNLDDERLQNELEGLRRRLELTKEGSLEELQIRKEINDLLLEEQERALDKADKLKEDNLKKDKDRLKELTDLTSAALGAIEQITSDAFAKTLSSIDDQLNATERRINELQAKAAEGRLDADESIALERQREAELEKKRRLEEKRQAVTQALFTVLNTFNANVAAGVPNPLAKTFTDVTALRAIAGTLSAFDGVEDTGGRGNSDSKGGKQWTLHPNERVLTKKQNDPLLKLGIGNEELSHAGQLYASGAFTDTGDMFNAQALQLNGMNTKAMEGQLGEVKDAINNIEFPYMDFNEDKLRKMLVISRTKGSKVTRERSKLHN